MNSKSKPTPTNPSSKGRSDNAWDRRIHPSHRLLSKANPETCAPGSSSPSLTSNYELFNCNNISIHYPIWFYRGCWHHDCPRIVPHQGLYIRSIPIALRSCRLALLLIVTASGVSLVASYAPAAVLRSGSRLSGSLSGVEPWFPVTRQHHGRPLSYHPQLISQKFE